MDENQPRTTLVLSKVCGELFYSTLPSGCTLDCVCFLSPEPPVSEGSQSLDG